MNVTFFDQEDQANDLNGTVIGDNARLFQILESLRNRLPFTCELQGENGFCLIVGIGKVGFVQYARCDGSPPYLVAIADGKESQDGYSEFLCGGTPTPIPNRNCMPFDSIREIAGYFRETGRAHPFWRWEEV
jgi:hypothetical protein